MIEHWPAIISAIGVGAVALIIKYSFVTKGDCKQDRDTMCKKIQAARDSGTKKTDVLTSGAKDNLDILNGIREEISGVREDLGAMRGAFEQFLRDQK